MKRKPKRTPAVWGSYGDDELEALPDDNTVGDPVEGERKYQEWLSAMNSTEAWLGMVPRSDPYVPPEQRPPKNVPLPDMRITRKGVYIFLMVVLLGSLTAVFVATRSGLGESGEGTARSAGLIRISVASLVGTILASPVGIVLALIFGRVEEGFDQEEGDDTGTGGSATA